MGVEEQKGIRTGVKLSLAVRLRMGHQAHGGIGGRHGDRSVERSTPLPCLHQSLGLVVGHTPHFEVDPDGIIDGELPLLLLRVSP